MNNHILEVNKRLIETYFYEVWNQGNLTLLDRIIDEHYINHSPGGTDIPPPGPAGLRPIVTAMRKGFPDLHYEIRDLVITEDRIVARVWMTATHLGVLWGLAPTGKKISVDQINMEHVSDGKIIAHWRLTDEWKMMKQLEQIR